MILLQKTENNYKKVKNKLDKAKMIKALICDLGGKGTSILARLLNIAFNRVKLYFLTDFNNVQQTFEFHRRKKVENKFSEIKSKLKIYLRFMNILTLILKRKLCLLIYHYKV